MGDETGVGRSNAAPREGVAPFMRRFAADESGIFIILFAISFSAMALAAAIALDFARISLERTEMQRALDAAALAAAHRLGMPDQDQSGPAAAMAFFKANVPAGSPLSIEELKLDAAAGEVVISSGGSIATTFLSAFGINSVNVGAGSRVVRGDGTVEVALVLDNSGSMAGGNFSRWQSHITDWRRNLYAGPDQAVAVGADELLLVSEQGPHVLIELGLTPVALHAVALDKTPAHRWLAKLDCAQARASDLQGLNVYRAMTVQLQS